jgi:hypothetical protein
MPSKLEMRVAQHDREIAAIRKLIVAGMKMISSNNAQIRALAASQRKTDRMLQDLLRSLGRRDATNGHGKPPQDLE